MEINTSLHRGEVKASCAGRLAGRVLALRRQWKLFSYVQVLVITLYIPSNLKNSNQGRNCHQSTLQLSWHLAPWKLGTENKRKVHVVLTFFEENLWVWDVLSLSFQRRSTAPGSPCKNEFVYQWHSDQGNQLSSAGSRGVGTSWSATVLALGEHGRHCRCSLFSVTGNLL